MNNVFLVGMPGCGKSTVAAVFERKYDARVYDTDAVITSRYGEILKIFAEKGEYYFRNVETEVLKYLNDTERGCVVSVGGGCILREENVKIMKSDGNKVVYLRAGISTLCGRLKNDLSRPLLKGDIEGNLRKLYTERSNIYEGAADIIADTDGLSPEEIVEDISIKLRGK